MNWKEEFTVGKLEKIALIFVFYHIVMGVLLSWGNQTYFEGSYAREDGFIEWFTNDALFFGMVLCFYRAIKLYKVKGLLFSSSLFLMGLVFLFGAGEEISWGQRIFDFESPAFFKKYNSQMETNLHNLVFEGKKINKIIFGTFLGICIGFYMLILPWLFKKIEKVRRVVNRLAIPIPRMIHLACYLLLVLFVKFTDSGKKGELLEFGGCWFFLLMLYSPINSAIYKVDHK